MIRDYKLIIEEIKEQLNIDIFEETRKRTVVTARTLFIYILRKDWNYSLYKIRDIFIENGKKMHHATLLHNIKMYDITKKEEPKLEKIRARILKSNPLQIELIEKIKRIENQDKLEQINNCIIYNE
jgi:chromosomal replication initiation ATPase DnaA